MKFLVRYCLAYVYFLDRLSFSKQAENLLETGM